MKFLDVPQSGSFAGNTHSHNRAGQYRRNRRSPVQPIGTGRRAFIRSTFGAASATFATLTQAQISAWDSFAADHPIVDSLGQSIILTGHQMFVRVFTSATNVGLSPASSPPADLDLPDLSDATTAFSIATGVALGFPNATGGIVAVAFSRPMSPARTFNKTFWQPLGSDGYSAYATGVLGYDLDTSVYAAEFGTPIAGQKVFIRVTPVSDDGWNGAPNIFQVLVTA